MNTPTSGSPQGKSTDPFTEGWIDDNNLYYRGPTPPTPPTPKAWREEDWVYLPHESYIPISKSRVNTAAFKEIKAGEHAPSDLQLEHFVRLLEGIYHFHYHHVLNELKEDYEYFSPQLGKEMREGVSAEELKRREQRFMINFVLLMNRGNFNPLNDHEQRHAEQHSYLLDLPVEVNWKIQDPQPIKELLAFSDTEEGRERLKEIIGDQPLREYLSIPEAYEERILVFHRGVTPDRVEGLFIPQKLNVLIDRLFELVFKPVQKSVNSVANMAFGKSHEEQELEDEDINSGVVFLPRWLRRTSLQNQEVNAGNFFKTALLQEPAMERVICLFRLYPPSPPPFLQRIPLLKRFLKTPEPDAKDPTLYVKLFQNIPMADLELVFPEKHIRMKAFDKFMLGFLGFIGLVAGVWKGINGGDKSAIMVILSVMALLAFKTLTRFINTRRRYMLQISQDLYHKNLDNDVGVLQYLVDSIEDQEYKESMLAYLMLLNAGRPLTEDELDGEVERFLNKNFSGLEVDFEVDDALDKVCVHVDAQGQEALTETQAHSTKFVPIVQCVTGPDGVERFSAKPIEEALRLMDEKWDNFFDYN